MGVMMDVVQSGRTDDAVPARVVRDEEGQEWVVREFIRARAGREDRSLLFDCGVAIRRVRDFPLDWQTLSDEALLRVSQRR